jgi:hypothetical protein
MNNTKDTALNNKFMADNSESTYKHDFLLLEVAK